MPTENGDFFYSIEAVFLAFGAVIAVALERFYSKPDLVDDQRFDDSKKYMWCLPPSGVFYWAALAVLVSLSVRFLVGSSVHLHHSNAVAPEAVRDFLWYTLWLFIFGSIIVGASFQTTVRGFAKWLIYFSVAGVLWSTIAIFVGDKSNDQTVRLAKGWFWINLAQLATAAILCWVSDSKRKGKNSQVSWLLGIAFVFGVLFIIDLCHILGGTEGFGKCILSVLHLG